jgi:hypothetical protein
VSRIGCKRPCTLALPVLYALALFRPEVAILRVAQHHRQQD